MLDDTVGALTRSVYDSSASTDIAFTKLSATLKEVQNKADQFTVESTTTSTNLGKAIKMSKFSTQQALSQSEQITNGISNTASSAVLAKLIKTMQKSNKYLITSIKHKNNLKEIIDLKSKSLGVLGRQVTGNTNKSFAVMSVANKICENAKTLQTISKNVIDKAERHHLALASPEFKLGVENVARIVGIEKKIFPMKTTPVEEVVPQAIESELESAYQHNNIAIDHAQKALDLGGSARAREVVDVRDELRTVMDRAQDVMDLKRIVTDRKIAKEIVPRNVNLNNVIAKELIPEIEKFEGINRKILEIVDQNNSIQIDTGITRKVLKQSSFGKILVLGNMAMKRQEFSNFL